MTRLEMLRVLLAPVLTLSVATALADSRCGKIERQDELNQCLGAELASADKALNSAYGELRRMLPLERQELLKKAETSWISLRDKDCEFEASAAAGGTAYQALLLSCQLEATKARRRLLQEWRHVP
jgi:uncharacterized protein YecT (DUF1311 family)